MHGLILGILGLDNFKRLLAAGNIKTPQNSIHTGILRGFNPWKISSDFFHAHGGEAC